MYNPEVEANIAQKGRQTPFKLALAGNPNSGKSSVFNLLTGLNQKTGNFPGVTVDKRSGTFKTDLGHTVTLIDFPGTYSLYPNSLDERIVIQTFTNPEDENFPDGFLYVADVTKLDKHILLLTQLIDLGLPIILILNMQDLAQKDGLEINQDILSDFFGIQVVGISSRTNDGVTELKEAISKMVDTAGTKNNKSHTSFIPFKDQEKAVINYIREKYPALNNYQALLVGHHFSWLPFISSEEKSAISKSTEIQTFESLKSQIIETLSRFDKFTPIIQKSLLKGNREEPQTITEKADQFLTHPIWGTLFFSIIMVLVFQAIYAWASYPMDWIEQTFGFLGDTVKAVMYKGWLSDLITDGILAGLGGILVFIPQIAILFFLISILEEVGYMARAVYLFDRLMQVFGLNGRSIVALISGGACAIPAIMSTRTISNWKERLITILVTPLISCSARIPVYAILVGFVVPPKTVMGIFNLQGLAFMGLYLLGIAAALLSALVFKLILKSKESSFLILELPEYRMPVIRNVGLAVWEKVRTFVLEAGKVILVISVVLWFLASFGPAKAMQQAEQEASSIAVTQQLSEEEAANLLASKKIESSYAGQLGKFIEPVIQPLGFDWKIGIALITSFAAREVFIGTMATIYSIGSAEDEFSIKEKMAKEINPATGLPVYNLATSLSLLIFYVFAMQCMSTLAVVKRETKSWKWPIIQFVFMSVLAYLGSWIVFQIFS